MVVDDIEYYLVQLVYVSRSRPRHRRRPLT